MQESNEVVIANHTEGMIMGKNADDVYLPSCVAQETHKHKRIQRFDIIIIIIIIIISIIIIIIIIIIILTGIPPHGNRNHFFFAKTFLLQGLAGSLDSGVA